MDNINERRWPRRSKRWGQWQVLSERGSRVSAPAIGRCPSVVLPGLPILWHQMSGFLCENFCYLNESNEILKIQSINQNKENMFIGHQFVTSVLRHSLELWKCRPKKKSTPKEWKFLLQTPPTYSFTPFSLKTWKSNLIGGVRMEPLSSPLVCCARYILILHKWKKI